MWLKHRSKSEPEVADQLTLTKSNEPLHYVACLLADLGDVVDG
jgi:hypothetical protein